MTRDVSATVHALRVLRDAAASVARDAWLVPALAASTGLSPAGVTLALEQSLELHASEADLEGLARRATPATRVHVVLSAGVFTAAFRAIAVARASSAVVTVRPSRRDPVFARALVTAAMGAGVALAESLAVGEVADGEIHIYGRDETAEAVRTAAREDVRVRRHGAGLGVVLITERVALGAAARLVADDVIVFDQRGCLSPRVALVLGDAGRAADFATALHARLEELGRVVPRGTLTDAERESARRYADTVAFAGRVLVGTDHLVGLSCEWAPVALPPAGRHVHVASVGDLGAARRALLPIARWIVAVGCEDPMAGRSLVDAARRVRVSRLGAMQRPPLDGPVDLR